MLRGMNRPIPRSSSHPPPKAFAPTVLTESTGDVLRHGLAWLGGDFRDGPSDEIATGETIILESDAAIGLEYDGELAEVPSPARFGLGASAVDFLATA